MVVWRKPVGIAVGCGLLAAGVLAAPAAGAAGQAGQAAGTRPAAHAGPAQGRFPAAVERALRDAVDRTKAATGAPGVTVGVWAPGRGSFTYTPGVADLSTGRPLQAADRVRIASITKTYTATAVLRLVDRHLIGLDDPLSRYLDWPDGDRITVRQLLNMTAGVYSYTEDPAFLARYHAHPFGPFSPGDALAVARAHPPYFAPGAGFHYSDTNYVLLGIVLERATGRPVGDVIRREVVQPLGLRSTEYPSDPSIRRPFAHGYDTGGPGGALRDVTRANPGYAGAAGAMISDLGDLRTWARALSEGTLLSPRTHAAQLETVPVADGGQVSYGLGILDFAGFLGHNGAILGYNSAMFRLPETGATIVVEITKCDLEDDAATPLFVELARILYPERFPAAG
ncbi:serine hydrolase [Kitasatospora sp. NE20-6]|uniref:serine hydrolase domain-containing protein n=1 Tax=Kitasatospora sp. NE20-6 TaxID=2859066 RepID=UPI0034DC14E0